MKTFDHVNARRGMAVAAGLAALACLNSCEDAQKQEPKPEAPKAAETTAAETPAKEEQRADTLAESRDALFHAAMDIMVAASANDDFPAFNSKSRSALELLEKYYADLQAGSKDSRERVRTACAVAKVLRNLGSAHVRAEAAYRQALVEYETLPKADRKAPEGCQLLSSIYNGIASSILMQGKPADALEFYQKALEVDKAQFEAVDMKEGDTLEGKDKVSAFSRAVADVVDSYRCLGDCQRVADDPEEAMDTYKAGMEIVQKYGKQFTIQMGISFAKLATAYGDELQRRGDTEKARAAWATALNMCRVAYQSAVDNMDKLEIARVHEPLVKVLKETMPADAPAAEDTEGTDAPAAE